MRRTIVFACAVLVAAVLSAQPDNWCQCPDGTCVRPVLWGVVCPEGCLLAPDCTSEPYPAPTPTPVPTPQPTPTPTPPPGPTPTPQPSEWRTGAWTEIPAPWNYLENGTAILNADGTVAVWLNAAKCCYHPNDSRWLPETIVQLRIGAARTWHVLRPGNAPDEHEQGYPKPLLVESAPLQQSTHFAVTADAPALFVATATTKTSTIGQDHRAGVAFAVTALDGTYAGVTLNGIPPPGADLFPLGWSWRHGRPLLWVREHRVGIGYTVAAYLVDVAAGRWVYMGQSQWGAGGTNAPHVNDVAWGDGGVLYALATPGVWDSETIEEYYSAPEGGWGLPGRLWQRTGRVWRAPPGEAYHAAAYLRHPDGRRVEPTVIVATQHAAGAWATEGWYLGWIAHVDARLPAGW